jgi:molecular chaperone GrpE
LPTQRAKISKIEEPQKPLDFIEHFRSQIDDLQREKEQSDKRAAEYLERLQRLQADMENLQKITKRQIDMVTQQASAGLLMKLLPILDALHQAGKVTETGDSLPAEEISVGLKMIFNQLMDILKGEGLEEITALGQALNPERHEVVSYIETDDVPENMIVEEVRRGYALRGKVIRPSLVVVSRRKTAKDEGPEQTESA